MYKYSGCDFNTIPNAAWLSHVSPPTALLHFQACDYNTHDASRFLGTIHQPYTYTYTYRTLFSMRGQRLIMRRTFGLLLHPLTGALGHFSPAVSFT